MRQIVDALTVMHECRVMHRGFKSYLQNFHKCVHLSLISQTSNLPMCFLHPTVKSSSWVISVSAPQLFFLSTNALCGFSRTGEVVWVEDVRDILSGWYAILYVSRGYSGKRAVAGRKLLQDDFSSYFIFRPNMTPEQSFKL